jgi:tRNA-intron endonuclease
MLNLKLGQKEVVYAQEPETVEKLKKNFFGTEEKDRMVLFPEEVLFLVNFQNAVVTTEDGREMKFEELAGLFSKTEPRIFVKYNAYRDWRDRGLIARRIEGKIPQGNAKDEVKKYPAQEFSDKITASVVWFPDTMFALLEDQAVGRYLFDNYWFGQFGVYKQERGEGLKMELFEVIFLEKHAGLKVINAHTEKPVTAEAMLKCAEKGREFARQLYDIYEDWRLRGYVVKTGFKFGTHFRIYFPGASPAKGGDWVHSRHVLHVFPKEQKLVISEWARAVRVAHGVKKTFVLGIPEMRPADLKDMPATFIAYRRKRFGKDLVREDPSDKPRYLLVDVSEDEQIGGVELASLLHKAREAGLELLLSITDRETAITYYVLKAVTLPGSPFEYYEIEWMKP